MGRGLVLLVAVGLAASACSGSVSFSVGGKSPEDAASELIEGDLADRLGVPLSASCPDLEDPAEGDQFECTGTTDDGQVIDFVVDIGEDEVFANSRNVLAADDLPGFEQTIIDALNAENQLEIPDGALDCGADAVIVPPSSDILCRLTDVASGDVYDTTVTITDQAAWSFSIQVADEPS